MHNSFGSKSTIQVGGQDYLIHRLRSLYDQYPEAERLPYSLKILLENLLRTAPDDEASRAAIEATARWDPAAAPSVELAFMPSRVIHQDFTGVPSIVDLAAMRDALARLGGDPRLINPRQPVELVIDHSVQVDDYAHAAAFTINAEREFSRNRERYRFLRWGQRTFRSFEVVPPQTGIIHQVNLEHLARVVFVADDGPTPMLYPDTVVGTDSHTTMINGLGVLGWGVGGIEAEAVMLGEPISMLLPQVVGFELRGSLREGATATDLVLMITETLRAHGVVGKFVEFFGDGLASLSLADRATIANMAPEYGATCGIFPIDDETLRYMRLTGRPAAQVERTEVYAKVQGMFYEGGAWARYTDTLSLELDAVEPSLAGPRRPQDRLPLAQTKASLEAAVASVSARKAAPDDDAGRADARPRVELELDGERHELGDGAIVIAAITSCTNTSNPALLFAAGLVAQRAAARGLRTKPWVKTSFAPGSRAATAYLRKAGLMRSLEQLGFYLVGYGCTTCVGNSGPLRPEVSRALAEGDLVACSVLSGNRNFEGRVHPEVRANYLASPPLVVAFALAGRLDVDLSSEPLGVDVDGRPVYLRELWPSSEEIHAALDAALDADTFAQVYDEVFTGDARWQQLQVPEGDRYAWDPESTYIKHPPYFEGMSAQLPALEGVTGARVLALLGDSITTDHISPAGAIKPIDGPAGRYLSAKGVAPADFNAFGSRRGNHELMVRGTFANLRLRNRLAPGTEGGYTRHFPSGELTTIFDAAETYRGEGVPLLIIAGKEYGTGSSRDWAAKGTRLLGVRAVIAESFERIHRSNLIGMGVVPLQFAAGESASSLGLSGAERYDIIDLDRTIERDFEDGREVVVRAHDESGAVREFEVTIRIDTPRERLYYTHGGILQYVLRRLLAEEQS